jgi:hypothetical protein
MKSVAMFGGKEAHPQGKDDVKKLQRVSTSQDVHNIEENQPAP